MPLIRSGASCIVLRMTVSVLPATVLHMGRIVAVAVTGFVGLAVGLGGCVALVGGAVGGTIVERFRGGPGRRDRVDDIGAGRGRPAR